MARGKLNARQRKFVLVFVKTGNATQAAREAGYSLRTADRQGHDLLKNPEIAGEIAKRQGQLAIRLEISAERLVTEMARLAFCDPRKLFGPDGMLRHINELDDDMAAAISSVEVLTRPMKNAPLGMIEQITKIRLHGKNGAIQNLARALGLRGFRPSVLDLPPPDPSPNGQGRIALGDLLSDLSPEELARFRANVDMLKAAEQRRITRTIDGEAEEQPDEGDAEAEDGE
ncbi:MAG: terminase small subunit [Stellaceae bacterium]